MAGLRTAWAAGAYVAFARRFLPGPRRPAKALGGARRLFQPRWVGAFDHEPQHDRQLAEQGRLGIGKRLVLILRKEEPREAQDDVGDAVDDGPHPNEPRQEARFVRQGAHREEPEPPQDLGSNDLMVMPAEEQQDQSITLRLVEDR